MLVFVEVFTGEFKKKWGDEIYNEIRHVLPHQPVIFINDQEPDKKYYI